MQVILDNYGEIKLIKISIIMPVFNVQNYLSKSIESFMSQSLRDIELICIDDCSEDDSYNILKEYSIKDKRIKIVRLEKNVGPGAARNIGISKSSGKYIMFLDPDDWLEPFACSDAYNQIETNNNDIVFFNVYIYSEFKNFGSIDTYRLAPFWGYTAEKQIKLRNIEKPFISTGEIWYKIYRTSFIKSNNIHFSTARLGEDSQFTVLAYIYANTVSVLNKVLYNYRRQRPKSASSSQNYSRFEEYLEVKKNILNNIIDNEQFHWILKSYIPYYIRSIFFFYNKFRKGINKGKKKFLYNKVNEELLSLNKKVDVSQYIGPKAYKTFSFFIKHSYYEYKLLKFFNKRVVKNGNF